MQEYRIMGNRVAESVMMERRITLRLLGYWEKLRGPRPMPAECEIDPEDIKDLWDDCMLLRVNEMDRTDYIYTYMGPSILEAYRRAPSEGDGPLQAGSLASLNSASLTLGCHKVIQSCKPLLDEGEFYNLHNQLVKYRLCLLPLGEGGTVQAIFGGMRFKVFA